MTHKFAERGATQCGHRFLDSSVPRLVRHAALCEAAGGERSSSPAGKDQKLSRGLGQSPKVLRARSARSAFLVHQLTHNCNSAGKTWS
jgi:hypothetical protein